MKKSTKHNEEHTPDLLAFSPRLVLRGAKCQVEVGFDWLRLVGPRSEASWLRHEVSKRLGRPVSLMQGTKWVQFTGGERYAGSALVLWTDEDREKASSCVDLPGDVLGELHDDDVLTFCREAYAKGFRATRADLRIDFRHDKGVGLTDAIFEACERGELCGAKRFKLHRERSTAGHLLNDGVALGARGKQGSGRFVRVYDKGLEQQALPAGKWQRYEAELTKDIAREAVDRIITADNWRQELTAIAFGAVDFRESNGDAHMDRRPRANWWAELLAVVEPVKLRKPRRPQRLERYIKWVRDTVAPSLKAMAEATSREAAELFMHFATNERAPRHKRRSELVEQWLRWCDDVQPEYGGAIAFP